MNFFKNTFAATTPEIRMVQKDNFHLIVVVFGNIDMSQQFFTVNVFKSFVKP